MRKLEDCKAEVFRRSEERIKERKRNRNRALACCIPLCLLLLAGGIYIRPLLQPVDEIGGMEAEDYAILDRKLGGMTVEQFGTVTVYTSVEITDRTGDVEVSREITEKATVGALFEGMMRYFDMPVKESIVEDATVGKTVVAESFDGTEQDETTAEHDRDTIVDDIKKKYDPEEKQVDYKLAFRSSTGEDFIFCLNGNVLYDEKDDCVVKLSDVQLSELKILLDSTEESKADK